MNATDCLVVLIEQNVKENVLSCSLYGFDFRLKRSVQDPLLALEILESLADELRTQVFTQQ